ncbi:hypothetical protein JIN84_18110 [Luteolibacter yonseiensis]|uniref:Uncharacterized protein n=1 Tax=Luteolibacter yonseiensis TaxID=1144680 RepID=A0A934R981_9BACT|nr:hypothetical protein [Luteolibacter yonseiensis]MBK1817540.1 hypothetical protein [Luteolibacter yonseiensis]
MRLRESFLSLIVGYLIPTGALSAQTSTVENPAWVYPRLELPEVKPGPFLHSWKLKDGRVLKGTPEGRKMNQIVLKNTKGATAILPETDLVTEDQVRFRFWEATATPASLPRLDLVYRLTTSARGAFEVRINTEGTRGRVEFPVERSTLIYDMADGAFIWTIYRVMKDGKIGLGQKQWGRFDQMRLLPYDPQLFSTDLLCRLFLEKGPERASTSKLTGYPARYMTYPFPAAQETVHALKLDYVLVESLTALAGLYHFLASPPPASSGENVFYHKPDIGGHHDFRNHMKLLGMSRILPLRMEWSNSLGSSNDAETFRITKGPFSIELISATIPEGYPAGHFDIPADARTMSPGSVKKER